MRELPSPTTILVVGCEAHHSRDEGRSRDFEGAEFELVVFTWIFISKLTQLDPPTNFNSLPSHVKG